MKNIIFIAPPAAGKGTQSDLLVKKYNYEHISTGDLLREEVSSGSSLGLEIKAIIDKGLLVSTEIVTNLLTNKLMTTTKPFILDGYPRNEEQIFVLEDILKKVNKEIGVVIYLDVDKDTLIKRVTGRLMCPKCNKTYHKYFAKPLKDNICDDCNAPLISRDDDTKETFMVRYDSYIKNTKPVIDYYKNNGLLVSITGTDFNDVFAKIENVIK